MSVPFMLAPMATIGHRAFRELVEGFGGCDLYYAEMIAAGSFLSGGRFEPYYADPLPRPDLLVYQVVGGDAELLARAAAELDGRGAFGVDVNMGCCAPEITRQGAGVRWMDDAEKARAMAGKVRAAVKNGRLSVKLRLGREDDPEALLRLCEGLKAEGVEHFTLHPRTATEKFKRTARWERVGQLRERLGAPVSGNGDVDSAGALARRAAGPCDGVMVGRAAVRMPWIFADARAAEAGASVPADVDLEEVALRFLDLLRLRQPPEFWETRARRFFAYYCDNLKWAHHVRTLLGREKEPGAMAEVLKRHFRENPEERTVRRRPSSESAS